MNNVKLSIIVRVNVVLNRNVVVDSHCQQLFYQSEIRHGLERERRVKILSKAKFFMS